MSLYTIIPYFCKSGLAFFTEIDAFFNAFFVGILAGVAEKRHLYGICKQRGLTVIDTYCDRHISGRTDERPEFQRLIADAKRKKFEAVVVYKTDRFARNKYDSAVYKR